MSSHQNISNIFSSQTASSRVNEEIKRLQQLQRLRAATAACNFPSVGGSGSLLSNGSSNMNTGNNDNTGVLGGGSSGLATMGSSMDHGNNNSNNNVNNNPMFASFLAAHQQQQKQQQQQDETRLMLLQQQMRANSNTNNNAAAINSGFGNALQFSNTGAGMNQQAMASNLFGDTGGSNNLSLLTPSTLFQQQQLLLQQRQQQQQQASAQMIRPLVRVGAIEPFPEKLHRMLMEVESCGRGDVISFINDGRGFAIHKPGMSQCSSSW